MSNDEKRAVQAAALLEFEEAKAALALLRAKGEQWRVLYEKVHHLLCRSRRDSAQLEAAAASARLDIESRRAEFAPVMDLDAVLALDAEIESAVFRLKKAAATKRELGFL